MAGHAISVRAWQRVNSLPSLRRTRCRSWSVLYNIVLVLERFPRAGGAFGKHIPWPSASPFTARDVNDHFEWIARNPLALSRETDIERWLSGDKEWRQLLHYFSDNNSCLRRAVWQQVPYPELDFGEDQAWADRIIRQGYQKVYVLRLVSTIRTTIHLPTWRLVRLPKHSTLPRSLAIRYIIQLATSTNSSRKWITQTSDGQRPIRSLTRNSTGSSN